MRRIGIFVSGISLLANSAALADENFASFQHLSETQKPAIENFDDRWGPVKSDKLSLINLAPAFIPFFNNGPAFGLPGTVTGDIFERTQLTGDWGGLRTKLAQEGLFFDLYTTSAYQDITSGGLEEGSAFVQNAQFDLNIDTGRANLWDGGLIHVSLQSRYGDKAEDTLTAGASVPHYTGLVLPGPFLDSDTLPSEYFIAQALSKKTAVVIGKISDIFIPDETLFGDSYKYYFANFNFNKSPMTPNFYNPTAWAALGIYTPTPWLALAGGVLDPNSQSDNFADNAFDKVNLYLMATASYDIGGLPGQFSPAFNWSNKPKLDLAAPFTGLGRAQIPHAVATLLGGATADGLPANRQDTSWFAIANFSQYLYVKDDTLSAKDRLKNGEVVNGVGVFGRFGFAPQDTNPISRYASVGLFAHGLLDSRPYDSFGAGYYYNAISPDLKDSVQTLTGGEARMKDEKGTEVFYDFALSPAMRLIASYQHIWNPFAAQVADNKKGADVFSARMTASW
ncbi:carbohydrate porin [Rhizobium mesoamericanum]|uniref:carbohydrate porin n=1 Tax=Rhizobium mesoamericanum TaxID=1079800 RepID=UPI0004120937|nr:carbohydrate porin [Rhizobium mesoamericanum]